MNDDEFYAPGTPDREISIRRRVHRIAEFYRHLLVYAIVIGLLWALNALTVFQSTKELKWYFWWAMWPTLGWGIGLLAHAISVLPMWGLFSQDWEDRKVKELLEREPK